VGPGPAAAPGPGGVDRVHRARPGDQPLGAAGGGGRLRGGRGPRAGPPPIASLIKLLTCGSCTHTRRVLNTGLALVDRECRQVLVTDCHWLWRRLVPSFMGSPAGID